MKVYLRKTGSCFLVLILLLTTMAVYPVERAKAATIYDAATYTIGITKNGVIAVNATEQYYMFTLPYSGKIHLTGTAYLDWLDLVLFGESYQCRWDNV